MEEENAQKSELTHNTLQVPTIEANTVEEEDEYGYFPDRESRSIALQLADVGDMDLPEILKLSRLTEEEREQEILELKKEVKMYLFLMAMVAINSGWFNYVINVIIYYDKNDLLLTGAENAKIQSLLFLPWSFKPL